MAKIGLCVRYDCNNYGSMLQILATQKAIEKCGCEYEIIRYDKNTIGFLVKNVFRLFNPYFMRGKMMSFRKKQEMKKHPEVQEKNSVRLKLFREYRQKYIGPYSEKFKGFDKLVNGTDRYAAVMVGSDQLWTPAGIKSKFYNLLFVPEKIKKISFATSFGVTEIPKNQVKLTKEYLSRIEYLSVREKSGAEIVKKLTGRDAVVAADPTLLFTGAEWREIFPEEKIIEEPYILAYFLGTSAEHRDAVRKFAEAKGLKIVTCPHMDEFVEGDLSFGDYQKFDVSPVDFLNLIRGAEYICTDSFHGTVFSILNHKKFLTVNRYSDELRKSKNTRIDSLFELLGLQGRRFTGDYDKIAEKMTSEIDYASVDVRLQQLRDETFAFLKGALK